MLEKMATKLLIGAFCMAGVVSGVSAGQEKSAKEKKSDPSEQASKAGQLPHGRPGPGMVWVDSKTKTYYRQGDQMYGKTKKGACMSEGDAVNMGFHDRTQQPAKGNHDPQR
jgi:hypothetical protein